MFQPGDLVLDPMCGVGTILIEAAKSWPVGIPLPLLMFCLYTITVRI